MWTRQKWHDKYVCSKYHTIGLSARDTIAYVQYLISLNANTITQGRGKHQRLHLPGGIGVCLSRAVPVAVPFCLLVATIPWT